MINETLRVKWASTKIADDKYRLYRAKPGQAYLLVVTVERSEKGWKVKSWPAPRFAGKDSRRRWESAAGAVSFLDDDYAAQAILNPSNPEEL